MLAAAVAWGILFAWLSLPADGWPSLAAQLKGRHSDDYNLLVEGFLKGHLYLNAEVSPDLLSGNPEIRGRAPYLLDASLYRGHYYLYFGVVPAAGLLLPYRLLTAEEMGLPAATLLFWMAGFAVSIVWLLRWQRDLKPGAGPGLAVVSVSLLAILPSTACLVRIGDMYELAIAGGYAFVALETFSLYEVSRGRSTGRWLAAASLAFGLAVGCRPTLILLGPVLGWAALCSSRGLPPSAKARRLLAALAPAAAVGLLLGLYNYERFGNVADFGLTHQVDALFGASGRMPKLASLRFLPFNLLCYLGKPASFSCYFPFVFPENAFVVPRGYLYYGEALHGWLPGTVLTAWSILGLVAVRRRAFDRGFARWIGWCLAGGTLVALSLLTLAIRGERYMTDFLAPVAFAVVGMICRAWTQGGARLAPWRALAALLALVACLYSVLGSIELFDRFASSRPRTTAFLSRRLNTDSRLLARLGFRPPGRLRLTVRFDRPGTTVFEPLIVTGLPQHSDAVYVAVFPNGFVSFSLQHGETGGPRSALLPVVWGRDYRIDVDLGSFFPPPGDSYYAGMTPKAAWLRRNTARVVFDGQRVVEGLMAFYESPPWALHLGSNPIRFSGTAARFTGRIVAWSWEPPPPEPWKSPYRSGLLRFRMELPGNLGPAGQPLLAAGLPGEANLLYLSRRTDGRFQLLLDEWGRGAISGPAFMLSTGEEHRLEVFVGPLVDRRAIPPELTRRLLVWIDGRRLADLPLGDGPEVYDIVDAGCNPANFGSAAARFAGLLIPDPLDGAGRAALLDRVRDETNLSGLFRFKVEEPADPPPGGQPLIAAGRAGRGDLLFLEPLPDGRFRLAVDEWGYGLIAGEPFGLTAGREHRLEVVVGPMIMRSAARQGLPPALAGRLLAWIDGIKRADFGLRLAPEAFAPVEIGSNSAGFSTAGLVFNGTLIPEPLSGAARAALVARAVRTESP